MLGAPRSGAVAALLPVCSRLQAGASPVRDLARGSAAQALNSRLLQLLDAAPALGFAGIANRAVAPAFTVRYARSAQALIRTARLSLSVGRSDRRWVGADGGHGCALSPGRIANAPLRACGIGRASFPAYTGGRIAAVGIAGHAEPKLALAVFGLAEHRRHVAGAGGVAIGAGLLRRERGLAARAAWRWRFLGQRYYGRG